MGNLTEGLKSGYGMVLDALDQGVHIVDEHGTTIFYNHAMEKIEGLTKQQVMDKNILETFPSLTSDTSTLFKVLSTGAAVKEHVQNYTNKFGKRITTITSTMPIWGGGRMVGAVEVARDITLIRNLQDRIMDLQQAFFKEAIEPGEHSGASFKFNDILGESPAMKKTVEHARRAARTGSNILICGESGTGKEMVAQSVHNASPRWKNPFIAYNCAALPDGLLEGILFGTCKGSFTGAIDRPGLFEQANGGTILLDELNSMGLNLQAKLLRLLQERKVRRLGGTSEIPVDVRVIATVNSSVNELLESKELRHDLFYRLGVVTINIPALRERREDMALLTRHFIQRYNEQLGMEVTGISPEVQCLFMSYQWPGNVRELMHVMEGAMNVMGSERVIEIEYLPQYVLMHAKSSAGIAGEPTGRKEVGGHDNFFAPDPDLKESGLPGGDLPSMLNNIECAMIEKALQKHSGNLSRTAKELGIKRQSLQYKIQKYNINFPP